MSNQKGEKSYLRTQNQEVADPGFETRYVGFQRLHYLMLLPESGRITLCCRKLLLDFVWKTVTKEGITEEGKPNMKPVL